MTVSSIRCREAEREGSLRRRFRSRWSCRLLCSPARDFLPQQFAEFGHSTIGIGEVLGHSGLRAALGFEDDAILFDDLEVLPLPKRLIQKPPLGSLPSAQFSISEEVDERAVNVNRCRETENSQNPFRPERKGDIEAYPQRIAAI